MRRFFALVAALSTAGCGAYWQAPQTVNNSIILNTAQYQAFSSGSASLGLFFTALGASGSQVVTVAQQSAPPGSIFTAVPSAGCAGVAGITGTSSATTSPAPSSSFTVTAIGVAPAGTCVFQITSSSPGPSAQIVVDTSKA